jgi:hypothetical protein
MNRRSEMIARISINAAFAEVAGAFSIFAIAAA